MLQQIQLGGLSNEAVLTSRASHGRNTITKKKRKTFAKSLLESFGDPMIKVLLIALGVNVIFLFHRSDWFESVGIAVAILIATLVSTISEYGSEAAFEKLQKEAESLHCRVRRGGETLLVPIEDLVKGDIVLLASGERVPADGVLLQGRLDVDQSALNGESVEAHKYIPKTSVPDKPNDFLHPEKLFSGTVVSAGEGVMQITRVGDQTFYGTLAAELQQDSRKSPMKLRLEALAKTISRFSYTGALFISIAYLFNVIVLDNNWNTALILATLADRQLMLSHLLHTATLAVTVIVMSVPEGLPMMITVVLSSNMRRMLKDNVLVRKLNGIETAGSLNILFTDKTGTLTHGRLEVSRLVTGANIEMGSEEVTRQDTAWRRMLASAIIHNSGAEWTGDQAIGGNATDRALVSFTAGFACESYKKLSSVPFSSDLKYMATNVEAQGEKITFIKGAPEKILPHCTEYYRADGSIAAITNPRGFYRTIEELAGQAMRIIAIATSASTVNTGNTGFGALKLVALIGIQDKIRREAKGGVKEVGLAGIQTVMITGDAKQTAIAIAKKTGIIRYPEDVVLTSAELAEMSDREVAEILPNLRVVARALPSDKIRLVTIAQARDLVVGMTGDGVNDAPALKKADVGFAMGSGTEVAKEAGDIVIYDDNFQSISKSILYGRTIFKNIRKFIIYQITINLCAVIVSIVAPFLGIDSPITVIQMLWLNIAMDTLAGLAFSGERPRAAYMNEPPKRRDEPVINRYMWVQIVTGSLYAGGLSLGLLMSPRIRAAFAEEGSLYALTAFFAFFMFVAIFQSFCARTHEINLFSYLSANKRFTVIMGTVAAIQLMIIYHGGTLFRTMGLEFNDLIGIILTAMTVIPVDMIKKFFYRSFGLRSGT